MLGERIASQSEVIRSIVSGNSQCYGVPHLVRALVETVDALVPVVARGVGEDPGVAGECAARDGLWQLLESLEPVRSGENRVQICRHVTDKEEQEHEHTEAKGEGKGEGRGNEERSRLHEKREAIRSSRVGTQVSLPLLVGLVPEVVHTVGAHRGEGAVEVVERDAVHRVDLPLNRVESALLIGTAAEENCSDLHCGYPTNARYENGGGGALRAKEAFFTTDA